MILMRLSRRKCPSSQLQPDLRFIRTLQSPHHIVPDKRTGRYRLSSKAFSPSSADGGLSGELEQILKGDGLSAIAMYPAVPRAVGAAAITIGQIRQTNATPEHDPVWKNWYHGSVFGIRGKIKNKLHEAATEIIQIDQAEAARQHALWDAAQRTVEF
jgi:hypothetical protein